MGKVKGILRLKVEAGLSHERIAAAVGLSKGAVTHYLQRALGLGTRSRYTRPTTAGLLVLTLGLVVVFPIPDAAERPSRWARYAKR